MEKGCVRERQRLFSLGPCPVVEGKATFLPPLDQTLIDSWDVRREQGTGCGPGSQAPSKLHQRRNSGKLPTFSSGRKSGDLSCG